ncbi:MAG: hypothetical protein NVV73_14530 [Cellvibrionaceae bacterium]|nr:hypothetical protein [Cellvibrionaceae bacterium]
MGGKTHDSFPLVDRAETDDLRVAVRELNQSIAYLSKMILQLQRSMNTKADTAATHQEKPETIH